MAEEIKQPKTVVDKVFERCRDFSKSLCDEFGEIEGVACTIDWRVGRNDFPAGIFLTRGDHPQPPEMAGMAEQLSKMLQRITMVYAEGMYKLHVGLSKEVADLEQRKQTLLAAAGDPPGVRPAG